MARADLHMHTPASDGTDDIETRIKQAQMDGLAAIAITDHDVISTELTDRYTVRDGIEVITGAEIKCAVTVAPDHQVSIEILSYFLDPSDDGLQGMLRTARRKRRDRIETFVENLNEMPEIAAKNDEYGGELSAQEVFEAAGEDTVGRPHIGEVLTEREYVDSVNQAFTDYIGDGSPAYVSTEKLDARHVIEMVHENGGYTSLAHPGRDLERETAADVIEALRRAGIDAIEVPYTYEAKRAADSFTINFGKKYARELQEAYGLGWTGGSDCHGQGSQKHYLGNGVDVHPDEIASVPYSVVDDIKASLGLA